MTFCTKCGHKNLAEVRFCEECGQPQGKPTQSTAQSDISHASADVHSRETSATVKHLPEKKLVTYLGVGFGVLLVIAAGLFFVFADETPSNEVFAKAIDLSLVNEPPPDLKSRYCLRNFAYDQDSVRINGNDKGTQRWLSVLTKAGLYSEPEMITEESGFFQSTALLYKKTEAGKKATQGRQLCVADGLAVARVESFSPPEKVGQIEVSRSNVTLVLRNPMPWVNATETLAIAPLLGEEINRSFILALKDGKWEVASERTVRNAEMEKQKLEDRNASSTTFSSSGGIFESLKNLFSFAGSNPLIGRWKSEMMGFDIANFEFDSDTMISNGQKVRVRYDVEDKRVTVYANGSAGGTIFNVIDKDTLSIDQGMMVIKLKRIR